MILWQRVRHIRLSGWVRASVLVMGLSLIGKSLGFWRELEIAHLFGVSATVDVFLAAFTLISFLSRMASSSFLVSVPRLVTELQRQDNISVAWGNLFRAIFLTSLVFFTLATLLLPPLVPWAFRGLDKAEQQLTTDLVVWMLPLVMGWTLVGALGGVLNAQGRYGGYQVALMVANVVILVMLMACARQFGIKALAWGWSIGIWGGVVLLTLLLHVEMQGLRQWAGLQRQWQVIRELLGGATSLFIWFALTQIPLWLDRYFAAYLAPGSISALGYAQRLFQLPLELMTVVVVNVWVVRVTKMPAGLFAKQTFRVMGKLALVVFPVAVILAVLAPLIVTFIYGRGAFDAHAIAITTGPFRMYALGLGFHTLSAILVRTFQAQGLTRYPIRVAGLDVMLTGALNAWVVGQGWGATGVAAVNTIVAASRVSLLSIALYLVSRKRERLLS